MPFFLAGSQAPLPLVVIAAVSTLALLAGLGATSVLAVLTDQGSALALAALVVVSATARWLPEGAHLLVAIAGTPLARALCWFGLRAAGHRLARNPGRVQHALAA